MLNSAMKPEKPGKPTDVNPAMTKNTLNRGIFARQASERRELAGVGLVVYNPHHGEHEGGHDAVREHLQRGAVDAQRGPGSRGP